VAAALCGNLGATHLQLGNYSRAKLYLQKCLQWNKEGQSVSMFDVLMNLGNLTSCESLEESVDWYHMAVEELECNQGSEEDWANVLFNLGRVYVQHQHWETARNFLEEAYHWTKEAHGEDHNSLAETFDLLGLVHMAQHHYDQALVAFTRAMAIHRRSKGPFHRNIAQSLLNMGLLRECQGEWSDSWEAYTTAHDLLLRLRTKQDDPLLEMICQSIHTVEVLIAKQTRDRMLQRSRSARTQYRAAFASSI
jgi:tetratricopeptide (TPR) repeat protein